MLSELSYSALTDVILACLQAFAAGCLIRPDVVKTSAAGVWALSMSLIAFTFMLGAIDHGFFEPVAHWLHEPLKITTRALAAVTSFFICVTAALQFLQSHHRKLVYIVSAAVNAAVILSLFLTDNFFIVMGTYSAAMLFLLTLSILGLKKGTGSLALTGGIVITFVASSLPIVGFELFSGFGIYATYHVVLMPAVLCFYLGGLKLDRQGPTLVK
ncbi:DUF6962 family protein [Terasakiella pusilla]|uniref:DUF6962 family protein n=1 Tax=Terasakiella pusilla TaxID=64973 RepID=UPI003AA809C1